MRTIEGVGEVWVRGRTVMQGYLDEPELTAESDRRRLAAHGRPRQLDVAGHLKLVGRAKNMIVTEGGQEHLPRGHRSRTFEDLPACEEHCVFAANYIWPTRGR